MRPNTKTRSGKQNITERYVGTHHWRNMRFQVELRLLPTTSMKMMAKQKVIKAIKTKSENKKEIEPWWVHYIRQKDWWIAPGVVVRYFPDNCILYPTRVGPARVKQLKQLEKNRVRRFMVFQIKTWGVHYLKLCERWRRERLEKYKQYDYLSVKTHLRAAQDQQQMLLKELKEHARGYKGG